MVSNYPDFHNNRCSGSGSGCWGYAYGGDSRPPGGKARKLEECGSTPPPCTGQRAGRRGAGYGPGAGGAGRGGRSLALKVSRLGAATVSCGRLFHSDMVLEMVPFHKGEFLSFPDNFFKFFE